MMAEAIRRWMRMVMEQRDWSAEAWARKAETSPTNITRFLNHEGSIPSTRTLAKLGDAAGSFPDLMPRRRAENETAVPLTKGLAHACGVLNGDVRPPAERVGARFSASSKAIGVTVDGPGCGTVEPDDVLILEPPDFRQPRIGRIVLTEGEGLVVGIWTGKAVVDGRGRILAGAEARVVGVAIELRRAL